MGTSQCGVIDVGDQMAVPDCDWCLGGREMQMVRHGAREHEMMTVLRRNGYGVVVVVVFYYVFFFFFVENDLARCDASASIALN